MKTDQLFFVFDVESVGLHGEGFAVAGGIYDLDGTAVREFAYHCPINAACGNPEDRNWVTENVMVCPGSDSFRSPKEVRECFWAEWMKAKEKGALMFVECGWPVEAAFVEACITDDRTSRNWEGPYPMHEIATLMLAAGMDPMATYEREPHELPAHEPLADARLSARLLATAFTSLKEREDAAWKYEDLSR